MMGSWKSTVGKLLAERVGWQFVDTDDLLTEKMKMSIPQVFQFLGEERFRREEALCLQQAADQRNRVVATGGGIVLNRSNREMLKNSHHTIFLKASPNILAQRIHNISNRPKLHGPGPLEEKISKLYDQRLDLYNTTAEYTIDTSALQTGEVVESILQKLELSYASH